MLGLIELSGEATPYELKSAVRITLGNFWSLQHAQLYSEPERLARRASEERREEGGRRRRHYSLDEAGAEALAEWRESPAERLLELRDLGLLKVFFGADPARVAEGQIEMYRRKLAEYEGLMSLDVGQQPRGPWTTRRWGSADTKLSIEFWEEQRREAAAAAGRLRRWPPPRNRSGPRCRCPGGTQGGQGHSAAAAGAPRLTAPAASSIATRPGGTARHRADRCLPRAR